MEWFEKSKIRLCFDENGEFRLLCVSDFHAPAERDWDERLIRAEEALLDEARPDLMMILGDLTHDGALDTRDRLERYAAAIAGPMEARGIPWAHVPGNHDREEGIPTEVFAAYPHCLSVRGPAELPGYGTYLLPVYPSDGGEEPALLLWAFDSHRGGVWERECGIPEPVEFRSQTTGFDRGGGVTHRQALWFWETDCRIEEVFGRRIPGIMLMHSPLAEHRLIPTNPSLTGMTGALEESCGIPSLNSGLFAAAYERGDILAVVAGHDHINTFAGRYMGIELSEDGSLGYDVYGSDDLRGGRLLTFCEPDVRDFTSEHVYLKNCPGAADFLFREGHDD